MKRNSSIPTTTPLFAVGRVVVTPQAHAALERNGMGAEALIQRHEHGDWGAVTADQRRWNTDAVAAGGPIMSAYRLRDFSPIWVLTGSERLVTMVQVPTDENALSPDPDTSL